MKECLVCTKCKRKMNISKEVRENLRSGLNYICACGGKYR